MMKGESTKLQNELNLFKDKYEKLSQEHHQKLKDIQFLQDEKISFEEKLEV